MLNMAGAITGAITGAMREGSKLLAAAHIVCALVERAMFPAEA